MTPFADHFLISILEEAWATVSTGGLAAWREIFPRKLPQAYADESWEVLSTRGVVVRSAFSAPAEEPEAAAVLSVALVPEEVMIEALNNANVQLDVTAVEPDNDRWTSLNKATLHVYIFANPKDVVRALHIFVLAALYSNQHWLYEAGFESMSYLGATDLAPQAEYFPKNVEVYGRVVRVVFSGMSDIGRITGSSGVAPAWITVADESVQVDTYVDPNTGTEHLLDETVPGGMKPRELDD